MEEQILIEQLPGLVHKDQETGQLMLNVREVLNEILRLKMENRQLYEILEGLAFKE